MAKVLFIIAQERFRDEELLQPREVLKKHNIEIASQTTSTATGMLGATIKPDLSLQDALKKIETYDAVIFVGGSGAANYFHDETTLEIARKAAESKKTKVLGAICIAPRILANAGVLKHKSATTWDDSTGVQAAELKAKGALFVQKDVVVDGKIVTACGPEAAKAFGKKIAEMLG